MANSPEISYISGAQKLFQAGVEFTNAKQISDAGGDLIDYWDIAQSHFFTVQIYGTNSLGKPTGLHDSAGSPINLSSGQGTYQNYLPLKSMNFNYTTYDNMNIPFNIFGDIPLLHRKKVTSINFSCYDTDQDVIEKALKYWEQQCFPDSLYVAYLADIAATLKYTSYDVKGRVNFIRTLDVIPASSVAVSRSYEENGAKLLSFSVVAVGTTGASALNGERIREAGYGTGEETAERVYTRDTSAKLLS